MTGAIHVVGELVDEGRELGQLVNDFTWYMRNLLLLQSSDEMEEVLDMSADNLAALREEAQMVEPEVLMRYIRIFSELSNQIKYAAQKRIVLEVAIIKLCRPQMETDYSSLVDRLDDLEKKLASGVVPIAPNAAAQAVTQSVAAPAEKPPMPKAIPDDIKQVVQNWKAILSEAGGLSRQYLNKAVPSLGNNGDLMLVFDDKNAFAYLNEDKAECMTHFKRLMENRVGKEIEVTLHMNESGRSAADTVPDLRQAINFDIEEEDF